LNEPSLQLVEYTQEYLDWSWQWLNDPEIRDLTMTPVFSREDQRRFFDSIGSRGGYDIWGVAFRDEPVGAAGLKNQRDGIAEYWGYIGKRELWGRGLGRSMVAGVEAKALQLGFSTLDLQVSAANQRAISLYRRMGFQVAREPAAGEIVVMIKHLSP
jgi:RimJ/RimL family protein N-acetyltransferase